jgi:hypothetical protein
VLFPFSGQRVHAVSGYSGAASHVLLEWLYGQELLRIAQVCTKAGTLFRAMVSAIGNANSCVFDSILMHSDTEENH